MKAVIAVHNITARRKETRHAIIIAYRPLCDTMDATIDKAAWSAACCRHQHCSCFTQQVHKYIRATLLECRGYPNTLYAFDSHTELRMRDKATLHQLNAIRLARHYRNQICYSWVTGCNRNLELFSEAASCYMDCKECGS